MFVKRDWAKDLACHFPLQTNRNGQAIKDNIVADLVEIIVFKSRGRDLAPLEKECGKDFIFHLIESEDDFIKTIRKRIISCIIVPLGTKEEGTRNARQFADIASLHLQPEDADITLIYSTEYMTPDDWQGALDPRPVRDLNEPS